MILRLPTVAGALVQGILSDGECNLPTMIRTLQGIALGGEHNMPTTRAEGPKHVFRTLVQGICMLIVKPPGVTLDAARVAHNIEEKEGKHNKRRYQSDS